jgi:3-deoxy-D-manno-octulosonic-acid transferase
MRVLYVFLITLAGLVLWPVMWINGWRNPAYRGRVSERFGYIPRQPDGIAVWVHAVSVGEVMAAMPLIRALIAQHGPRQVCVTTTTPTGSAQVRTQLNDDVLHFYAPIDVHSVVLRFLNRLQPRQVVIMETELWPTLFRRLRMRGIPLHIVNARLSPRSVTGYGRVRGFTHSVLADVTLVAAQSEGDAARYRQLGAPRVQTLGNLKFDIAPNPDQCQAAETIKTRWGHRPVWIAASTHEGEESAALRVHQRLLQRWPDAVLLLVPRHPPRFDGVQAQIEASGLSWARRSQADLIAPPPSVLLGDSMGEMWWYLSLADIAFVGGSLVPIGGHNVLEPAVLGRPVLFGPHMHNFEFARDLLLRAGGAEQVADEAALLTALETAFADVTHCQAMGAAARACLVPHQGALQRTLAALSTPSHSR